MSGLLPKKWRSFLTSFLTIVWVISNPTPPTAQNIIFIFTDDQEETLIKHMPNVKALIQAKGATFEQAYYNDPLCCPSRATMLTGMYVQNTGVDQNSHGEFVDAGLDTKTIAVVLHNAGYYTALVGKYMNAYPWPKPRNYVPPGWDDWHGRAGGTDIYTDFKLSDNGTINSYTAYSTDYYTDEAVRIIQRAPASKPLFLWLSYHAPHTPSTPAARHQGALSTVKIPRDAAFNEADVSDKPAYVRKLAPLSSGTINELDRHYRNMARSALAVDDGVTRVVDALSAAGRLANSYIVFASDNGWMHGQHRLHSGKGLPYNESARMILLVRGPNVPAGSKVQVLVSNADIAPTFAGWAGTAMPSGIDGRSFAPYLAAGSTATRRQALPMAYTFGTSGNERPGWTGIVTQAWKYVKYSTGEEEVYDRLNDPLELSNKVRTTSPALLAALRKRNTDLQACKGELCRNLENAPLQ